MGYVDEEEEKDAIGGHMMRNEAKNGGVKMGSKTKEKIWRWKTTKQKGKEGT